MNRLVMEIRELCKKHGVKVTVDFLQHNEEFILVAGTHPKPLTYDQAKELYDQLRQV